MLLRISLAFLVGFPTQPNREFFQTEQGNPEPETGSLLVDQGGMPSLSSLDGQIRQSV
jgi:hypothetical protein